MGKLDFVIPALESQRERDDAMIRDLIASGVDKTEAMRRILFSHISKDRFDEMCVEYERAFNPAPGQEAS